MDPVTVLAATGLATGLLSSRVRQIVSDVVRRPTIHSLVFDVGDRRVVISDVDHIDDETIRRLLHDAEASPDQAGGSGTRQEREDDE